MRCFALDFESRLLQLCLHKQHNQILLTHQTLSSQHYGSRLIDLQSHGRGAVARDDKLEIALPFENVQTTRAQVSLGISCRDAYISRIQLTRTEISIARIIASTIVWGHRTTMKDSNSSVVPTVLLFVVS
jgi:hypothetical protein